MRDERGRFVTGHAPTAFKDLSKWHIIVCPCGFKIHCRIKRTMPKKYCSSDCWYKYRKAGGPHSEETKRKIGVANKKFYTANPHKIPTWNGGVSFKRYTSEFKNRIRAEVRERDNYTCQECYLTEKLMGYKFSSHHIDYDTLNNSLDNLVLLCRSCHAKTNVRREQWKEYFQNRIYGKA